MTEEENKNKLIAGVLGGMGPLATVDFMSMVTEFCPIEKEEDHVRLLVDQNPHIPSRQIMTPEISTKIASTLSESAVNLENIGANFLVMPCNTAHKFYDLISDALEIPFTRKISIALSMSPPDSFIARLQSLNPAPVASLNFLTFSISLILI